MRKNTLLDSSFSYNVEIYVLRSSMKLATTVCAFPRRWRESDGYSDLSTIAIVGQQTQLNTAT